jgi:uncharacterized membrane protein YuzA (DUF378 family)
MLKKLIIVTALVVLIIGGLNWGLVGLFNFNLVAAIFGDGTFLARMIYILVGIAAAYTALRSPSCAHLGQRSSEPTVHSA